VGHRVAVTSGEALYPFQCSFIRAEQAAALTQYLQPVPHYLVALRFHSQAKYVFA
jgi:hypothetical protein